MIQTVKAGRGAKVHIRYNDAVQTFCGQGLGSRGGRMSHLTVTTAAADCGKCITKYQETH